MQAVRIQGIAERAHHVGLTHDFLEVARAPLTRENLVAHGTKSAGFTATRDYTPTAKARR
jgi:hypothetical protein